MSEVKDLTGQRFGLLTALYRNGSNKYGKAIWHCKCDCGNEKDINSSSLIQGYSQSCGCLQHKNATGRPKKYIVEVGKTYGDLKCIGTTKNENNYTKYIMKCNICGREKEMLGATVFVEHGITHKACGKGLKLKCKKFYERWQSMRSRTTNPNSPHYNCYGERGINSDVFENFIDFYDTMYESYCEKVKEIGEDNISLDRINPDGNYCPENCRWIDVHDQQSNCRKTIFFEVRTPKGDVEFGHSLQKYCDKHLLDYESARSCAIGEYSQHKGYKFKKISREEYMNFTGQAV